MNFFVLSLIKAGLVAFVLLTTLAYLQWIERKVLAHIQLRLGPSRVGPHGLLQPLADVIKLLTKEGFVPAHVNMFFYLLAPFLAVTIGWVLFRAPDFPSALGYLTAMADPSRTPERLFIMTPDLWFAMAAGLAICFLPAFPPVEQLREQVTARPHWATWSMLAACALLLLAIGKATTVAFHPFLYFRF